MRASRTNTFRTCFIGLMAAIVFVVNYLRIPFMGTQLHMTNALCVLCGLLFGPGAGFLAAGIGSRFAGGVKQLQGVGPSGEVIMDYSIHDALEAGFNKVVFIIRHDLEKDFKEIIGKNSRSNIN